ncbi:alpha/beta hydrolase family protein [Anaeromyxobacter oryzae]|uniref:Peptidase n=1 Tax=Anaeromyxobacter oryzae TaxID=2918170 RepID=A0ABM7X368_9BACT|nr:prolyl oligopeptidase family serine peptidase [Anaeromyxobacter oryzae]BDG06243.1 peptidase [Anaeromyxobacter oryzae]
MAGALALLLAASCSASHAVAPAARQAAPPDRKPDGAILSLRPILITDRSEYYALTYWSSGLRVNGFLGCPRDRTVRHPAVVWNRGGNRNFGAMDPRELVAYVEAGYVAVGSQYRGNMGSEGREAFGGDDVEDVLNLVTLLKQFPGVDATRIGMVGYSRGGMMTYRALREDARRAPRDIRVAATVGGLADLDDLDERPDMRPVYQALIGCLPSECRDAYVARSAVRWGGEMQAPLLLLHGEEDWRVSVEQSRRLAAAMRAVGRTVKLQTYPGDDHGLSAHGRGVPDILEWLGEHLGMPPESYAPERIDAAVQAVLEKWPWPAAEDGGDAPE